MIKKNTNCLIVAILAMALLVSSAFAMIPVQPSGDVETDIILVNIEDENDISYLKSTGARIIERYESGHALIEIDRSLIPELMQKGLSVDTLEHRTTLYLGEHVFDFTREEPDLREDLRIHGYEPGERGLYIVHMMGPMARSWRPTLEDKGVQVLNYVHNHAYRVRMTPEIARKIYELNFVDWVGIYHPEFKLQPGLEPGMVNVGVVPGVNYDSLHGIQEQILSMVDMGEAGYLLRMEVHSQEGLNELALMNDVYFISNHGELRPEDEMATQTIGGGLWYYDDGDPSTAYREYGDYGSYMNQIGYTGDGVVVAVTDTGLGDGTIGDAGHPDFTGRVIGGYAFGIDSWADQGGMTSGHGTHCAGSIAADTHHGTGSTVHNDYYRGQGSAPNAELFSVKIFNDGAEPPEDIFEVFEVAQQNSDVYVHSNSYGSYMNIGQYVARESRFDMAARDSNRASAENEPLMITKSSGNEGSTGISSPGNAKNIITVGASLNYPSNPDDIASISSRGWTADNRIKPDVVAPGINIYSTIQNGGYDSRSGTSMSNPAVAGAAAVVVEWYEVNYGVRPSPALVRAIIINTANDMCDDGGNTGPIPNRDEGWGMVDISKLERPFEDPVPFKFHDQETVFTESLQEKEHLVMADREDVPLKFSLTWTDKEAPPDTGEGRALMNDLDLEVESPSGEIYRGNAFSDGWSQPNTGAISDFDYNGDGWDDTNNVENVYIHPDDVEEGIYTVTIRARNIVEDAINLGYNNQDYALVVYNALEQIPGEPPSVTVNSPTGGEIWEARTDQDIIWTAEPGNDSISHIDLAYSLDDGLSWHQIAEDLPDTGSYSWEVPNVHSQQCLVKVSAVDEMGRTGEGISDGSFEIIGVPVEPPANLMVEHYGQVGIVTAFEEDFQEVSTGDIPDGWTATGDLPETWTVQNTDLAGGQAPELVHEPGDDISAYTPRIYTPPIDTSDQTEIEFSFRHYLDYYSDTSFNPTFKVQSSTDGSSWSDVWSIIIDGDIPATQVNVGMDSDHGVGSETLFISWTWERQYGATPRALNSWRIDDVAVFQEGTDEGDEHNLLTWDASPDDPDEVSHYNVYRSESSTGPWDENSLVDHVDADGSTDYEYVDWDKGMSDETYWWYLIRAVGTNGMEEDNTDSTQEPGAETTAFHIPLPSGGDSNGWNFVSFNLVLGSNELTDILEDTENGISGNYDRIMYFDSYSQKWLSYVPGRPEHFNNLRSWDNTMGIWIRMTAEDTLTVEGIEPSNTVLELHPGWNMVGLPSENAGNHDLPTEVSRVGYFAPSEEYNIAYTDEVDTFTFEPGHGYWVYNGADHAIQWTVTNERGHEI